MTGSALPTDTAARRRKRRRTQRRGDVGPETHDMTELVSLVCRYLCLGHTPASIYKIIKKNHGIEMHREKPYRYIAYAAQRGWLQYKPPPEYALRDRVKERYDWLDRVDVVHTATTDDVACQTAQVVIDLLRERANTLKREKKESTDDEPTTVRVGFAGGQAMRRVALKLAELLRAPAEGMPELIVFHSLVSGFSIDNPATDPNSFFSVFADDLAIPVKTGFVALHAPPVVTDQQFMSLRKLEGICEAFDLADQIDIIVTSGGSWEPPCVHSMLHDVMSALESIEVLENQDCCGDMMWRPLNRDGPITKRTKKRAMTLLELTDLPKLRREGKSIVFMLGPCRVCDAPRTELLRTILGFNDHLVTNLVTDSRTAAALLANSEASR